MIRYTSLIYWPFFARTFAHLARWAAAILLRPAAEMVRLLRVGFLPPYTATKAESAAFNPDNCFSTRSRSFLNCFTMLVMDAIVVHPSRLRIIAEREGY